MIVMKIQKNDVDRVFKFCEDNNIECNNWTLDEIRHRFELGFRTEQDVAKVKAFLTEKQPINVQSKEEWLKNQLVSFESWSKKKSR